MTCRSLPWVSVRIMLTESRDSTTSRQIHLTQVRRSSAVDSSRLVQKKAAPSRKSTTHRTVCSRGDRCRRSIPLAFRRQTWYWSSVTSSGSSGRNVPHAEVGTRGELTSTSSASRTSALGPVPPATSSPMTAKSIFRMLSCNAACQN